MNDGSAHAGIINVTTGTFTDLAKSLHDSSFSSSAVSDKSIGFLPSGDFLFTSNDTTYESAPPYQVTTPQYTKIGFPSPKASRNVYVDDSGMLPLTLLHLPADLKNQFGESYSSLDPAYAPITLGKDKDPSGCMQPQWLDEDTLLCYDTPRLGVANPGEALLDISNARVIPSADTYCSSGALCFIKYYWNVHSSALSYLLPDNSRTNGNFVPSPDGQSVIFTSALGETTSLEKVGRPTNGVPATPETVTISGINNYGHIVPVAWK